MARGLFLGICHGAHVTLDQFFAYHTHTISNVNGLKNCFAVVAAGVIRLVSSPSRLFCPFSCDSILLTPFDYSAVCLVLFVARAKKCLDFGVTLYFIDFLAQCFYSVRVHDLTSSSAQDEEHADDVLWGRNFP